MKFRILKIKDWLKFQKPDYEGFVEHLKEWEKLGIGKSIEGLGELAKNYGIKPPRLERDTFVFDVDVRPYTSAEYIDINITIEPTNG